MVQVSRCINRLANKQRRSFDALSFGDDLTAAQGKVLHFLLHRAGEPTFQRDVEGEFGFRPPTASALLKSLEANGYIRRIPVPDDGRRKSLEPTAKGESCKASLDAGIEGLEQRLVKGIPPDKLAVWLEVTRQMTDNL